MQTLDDVQQHIWQQLRRGKNDKKHPFRFGTLVTMSDTFPNPRTVVLRRVEQSTAQIWLYTDFRSPKVKDIISNNNVAWHFYNPKKQEQLRLYGTAEVIHNETINHEIWQNLPDYGKSDYLTRQAPGSIKNNDSKRLLSINNPQNFCVIITSIHLIDWLQLNREGHLRAKFERTKEEWLGSWLVA